MKYNLKSVYQYAMASKYHTLFSQQFAIALIIEFVETDNREGKENISF